MTGGAGCVCGASTRDATESSPALFCLASCCCCRTYSDTKRQTLSSGAGVPVETRARRDRVCGGLYLGVCRLFSGVASCKSLCVWVFEASKSHLEQYRRPRVQCSRSVVRQEVAAESV
ncbi:hypothetical protein PC118_g12237 [Phytophthora cactorum]|uniref:Uncharacterized protein n=1 Tax=Phytophthora cactorum TaxID=29920 RepID=A0A8T1ECR7_9STRA|nr:hypothetical protein PC111_g11350 [Phytophthora cactorum]KAG2863266.1 hypothetical protein PC113_g5578 [Phytophthora cactorum]KAG2920976.1 hypothetical protein PC114_g5866 [Phytophthora cactorum]KAG2935671.1 hypothetical protein PC115_g4831 [Phytophthora cactorum]KAG2949091.1 hypothetical protein PC117_g5512 [Phytophthora cactorum]